MERQYPLLASLNRRTKKSLRLSVFLFCFNLAFPLHLFANNPLIVESETASPSEIQAEQSLGEIHKQIVQSTSASSRLALTAVQRNVGMLLHQDLIDTQTGRVWDLTVEDLARPQVNVAAGLVSRALSVERVENGLALGISGNRYRHHIHFNPDIQLIDFDWDSEVVELLLSDGSRHVIEVSSLGPTKENMAQGLLFCAPVPVFYLGVAKSSKGPINKIRILQRRVDPVDQSRASQEARLDLNPATRARGLVAANRGLIKQVEENLELVRPIPLSPELETQLRAASEDGEPWLWAGDTALINDDAGNETIVGVDSRVAETAMIGLQMGPLTGLWHIASPESAQATQEVFQLRHSAKLAVEEIVGDELKTQEFFESGLQRALSHIPASALNATQEYASKLAKRLVQLRKQNTPEALRDRFTIEQQIKDYEYFCQYLTDLKTESARHEQKSRWNLSKYPEARRWGKWLGEVGTGIRHFNLPKRMRQAATVLRWPLIIGTTAAGIGAGGASVDYMATHGSHVALAADSIAAVWNHASDFTVPVFRDLNYVKNMALYTATSRTGLMLSVFLLAALARPFCQHSVNKLIAAMGIKYCFSLSILPPQRLLAHLTLRPQLIDAMKKGYLPIELLHPLGALSKNWNDRLTRASHDIDDRNRYRSLATALSLSVIAQKENLTLNQLLESEEGAQNQEASSHLALALSDILSNSKSGLDFRLLESEPNLFFESLSLARRHANRFVQSGTIKKRPLFSHLRSVVSRDLIIGVGQFQESRYQALKNPQPPQDFADYVVRGFFVDGIFTIMQTSLIGSYAQLDNPSDLAYQPDGKLWTNGKVWINDGEQMFLHLGASAAVDFLSAGLESRGTFDNLKPADAYDTDRKVGSRSFGQDGRDVARHLFNPIRNNYLVGFGERSWNQCVRLLQGFFVIGMALRLFEGVLGGGALSSLFSAHTFEHAVVGQLYFVFIAPFVYRWFWAVAITSTRTLQNEINQMGEGFQDHFNQLSKSLENRDLNRAEEAAKHLALLYVHHHRDVPEEVVQAIEKTDGESGLVWANRVLEACRNYPPVPERTNEWTNRSIIFLGSIITTYLAGFLMVDSFANRPFRGFDVPQGTMGFDWSDWFTWNGVSRQDSIPALMLKSLVNIWGVWGIGRLLDLGAASWRLSKEARTAETESAVKAVQKSVEGLYTMPGIGLLKPRESLLRDSQLKKCAEVLVNPGAET